MKARKDVCVPPFITAHPHSTKPSSSSALSSIYQKQFSPSTSHLAHFSKRLIALFRSRSFPSLFIDASLPQYYPLSLLIRKAFPSRLAGDGVLGL